MTDWLELCRAATAEVQVVLGELPTRDEREVVVGSGEGGDDTTAIDAAAEHAVVSLLDSSGVDFALVSEELGHRAAGAEGALTVVLDPIDGSINAKRGIPFFSLSIAVAEGPTMADVVFGYVYVDGPLPKDTIELLGLEATKTALVAEHAPALVAIAERLRVMGSLALSLCHLAAGRVDAVASLRPARSVDIAAAQLLVRERALAVELFDHPPFSAAPLDLVPRSRLAAAGTSEACAQLSAALR
jgi:myo-inositol-1(or 4)-monophosphatase